MNTEYTPNTEIETDDALQQTNQDITETYDKQVYTVSAPSPP